MSSLILLAVGMLLLAVAFLVWPAPPAAPTTAQRALCFLAALCGLIVLLIQVLNGRQL